jgi:hypothetical protein
MQNVKVRMQCLNETLATYFYILHLSFKIYYSTY